jgi:hypothetical protein
MPRRMRRLRRRRLRAQLDHGFLIWPDNLGSRPGSALVRVGTATRALRRPGRPSRLALGI